MKTSVLIEVEENVSKISGEIGEMAEATDFQFKNLISSMTNKCENIYGSRKLTFESLKAWNQCFRSSRTKMFKSEHFNPLRIQLFLVAPNVDVM